MGYGESTYVILRNFMPLRTRARARARTVDFLRDCVQARRDGSFWCKFHRLFIHREKELRMNERTRKMLQGGCWVAFYFRITFFQCVPNSLILRKTYCDKATCANIRHTAFRTTDMRKSFTFITVRCGFRYAVIYRPSQKGYFIIL